MTFLKKLFGRPDEPEPVYRQLRRRALDIRLDDLGLIEDPRKPIYGIVMESGYKTGAATFVCLAEGTVSLYTSTGGGIIGAGQHESVQSVSDILFESTNEYALDYINACRLDVDDPLPKPGKVAFHLLTSRGRYRADCNEKDLVERRDPFANLFANCHTVLTEVRLIDEAKRTAP